MDIPVYRGGDDPTTEDNLAEVVDRIFERLTLCLPHLVPRLPSLIISYIVATVIVYVGTVVARDDKIRMKDAKEEYNRKRWIFISAVTFLVAHYVQKAVFDQAYLFASMSANSQHFVNVYWISKYAQAMRTGMEK